MRRQLRCVRTILERNYYGMCLDFEDSKFLAIDPLTFASIMPNRKETSDKRGIKLSKLLVWNFRGFHSEVVNCTCSLRSETSTGKDFNFLSGAGTLTHSIFWSHGNLAPKQCSRTKFTRTGSFCHARVLSRLIGIDPSRPLFFHCSKFINVIS